MSVELEAASEELKFAPEAILTAEMLEKIAKAAHVVVVAYCTAIGESRQPWESTSLADRESFRSGVASFVSQPHITPEQQHEAWLRYKLENGWHFAPVKDEATKAHPCCLPYSALPEAQRVKDRIFQRAVAVACELLGVPLATPGSFVVTETTLPARD